MPQQIVQPPQMRSPLSSTHGASWQAFGQILANGYIHQMPLAPQMLLTRA